MIIDPKKTKLGGNFIVLLAPPPNTTTRTFLGKSTLKNIIGGLQIFNIGIL